MTGFEDKLNAVLGNQEAMGQIMALARSLSGEDESASLQPEEFDDGKEAPVAAQTQPLPDLTALLGGVDPGMLQMGMQLVQGFQGEDDRSAALLLALRPFLREKRQASLDRALQIARMTRLIRAVLGGVAGKGGEGDV